MATELRQEASESKRSRSASMWMFGGAVAVVGTVLLYAAHLLWVDYQSVAIARTQATVVSLMVSRVLHAVDAENGAKEAEAALAQIQQASVTLKSSVASHPPKVVDAIEYVERAERAVIYMGLLSAQHHYQSLLGAKGKLAATLMQGGPTASSISLLGNSIVEMQKGLDEIRKASAKTVTALAQLREQNDKIVQHFGQSAGLNVAEIDKVAADIKKSISLSP